MTNAPFSKVVETQMKNICYEHLSCDKNKLGVECSQKIVNAEAKAAIIAAHEADLREALEKLVAPHYDDWHQAYDYNRIAESVLAQLSSDKKGK